MKNGEAEKLLLKIADLIKSSVSIKPTGCGCEEKGQEATAAGGTKTDVSEDLQLLEAAEVDQPSQHIYENNGQKCLCVTDKLGQASPLEIVVDASGGFIPLWAQGVHLNWRFNSQSMRYFRYPDRARQALRGLLSSGIQLWGNGVPIRFSENADLWDFEIVMMRNDDCRDGGCVLASAFFPNGGRNALRIYPALFRQSAQEQVETLAHELGHVFGLRHFFAQVQEQQWPSRIFGTHSPFSIMNYGANSTMTEADRSDLARLYNAVWRREITQINGTPVRLMLPYHDSGIPMRG